MKDYSKLTIYYEDEEILVCEKPAGTPSQSDKTGDYDMVSIIKNYLYEKNRKGGEPYTAVVHRLDRPVGGIMVFAKTPFAAKELSKQIQNHKMKKFYLAIIHYDGRKEQQKDPVLLTDYLVKESKTNTSRVSAKEDRNAKKAELMYRILEAEEEKSLVEVELLTGRHHQIRVQMAEHLGPIVGDTKYNPAYKETASWNNIGLYAYRLIFRHPKNKKLMKFENLPQEEPFKK